MAYRHIEDTQVAPSKSTFFGRSGTNPDLLISNKTVKLSIWKCGHCRALAVTQGGEQPKGKCGKCHNA